MKKLVNIFACLVFVFLLTSVSFAKSNYTERTERNIEVNPCASLMGQLCDDATALAMSVSFQALVTCAGNTATSSACTTANNNAAQSQTNADYICSHEVQVRPPTVSVYSPTEKESIEKTKILNSKRSFRSASAR